MCSPRCLARSLDLSEIIFYPKYLPEGVKKGELAKKQLFNDLKLIVWSTTAVSCFFHKKISYHSLRRHILHLSCQRQTPTMAISLDQRGDSYWYDSIRK